MQKITKYVGILLVAAYVGPALADVTENVLLLTSNVTSLALGICFILGVTMVGGALIQYKQHKRNKLQVPISKPIVLFILGVAALLLPLLGKLAPGAQIISGMS